MADETTGEGGRRLVSVKEAAAALGRTPDAVRSMIRRRQLTARKGNDRGWLVELPDSPPPSDDSPDTGDGSLEVDYWRSEAEAANVRAAKAEALEQLVVELRAELAWHRRPLWKRLMGRE